MFHSSTPRRAALRILLALALAFGHSVSTLAMSDRDAPAATGAEHYCAPDKHASPSDPPGGERNACCIGTGHICTFDCAQTPVSLADSGLPDFFANVQSDSFIAATPATLAPQPPLRPPRA